MASVDVSTEIVIGRLPDEVAAFAGNPENAARWYKNIKSVQWPTSRPLGVGSRLAFEAEFLGKRLSYVYEVIELEPGKRMVMRTAEGPFPMETSYGWEAAGAGKTRMTLRNRGEPSGFSRLFSPLMSTMIRRENSKDLARLKQLLENP